MRRTSARPRLLLQRTSIALLLLIFALGGCLVNLPPFRGGIRMVAIATEELSGWQTPVSVPDDGQMSNPNGPGNGTLTSFTGETNDQGFDDYPDARDNAYWRTHENWASVWPNPDCNQLCTFRVLLPPGGHAFTCECFY